MVRKLHQWMSKYGVSILPQTYDSFVFTHTILITSLNKIYNMDTKNAKKKYSVFFVATMIGKLKRRIKKTRHRRYVLEEWLTT